MSSTHYFNFPIKRKQLKNIKKESLIKHRKIVYKILHKITQHKKVREIERVYYKWEKTVDGRVVNYIGKEE